MTDNEIIKAWDILAKFDFFQGQRAGRELWNEKPVDVQNEDIENFSKDVAFLKDFINRQNAEIERLEEDNSSLNETVSNLLEQFENIKSEAIQEFAERLKDGGIWVDLVSFTRIDNILKEMVGDKK